MADGLRNIVEAAEYLGIKENALRKMVSARVVPHTRVGKHVRFAQHHLDAIIEAGEQPVVSANRPVRAA